MELSMRTNIISISIAFSSQFNYFIMMSCRLSQEEVLELANKHGVPLKEGLCQNKFRMPDGSIGICECPFYKHLLSQDKVNSSWFSFFTVLLFELFGYSGRHF